MLASDQVIEFPLVDIVQPSLSTFFTGAHWGQCLELLCHLSQYGEKVILVTGQCGIGKTSMKYALEKRRFPNLRLIDDAHNLSLDQVAALLQIQDQRVVLFALPELIERIERSELQQDFVNCVRVIELEQLTFIELQQFLLHQWHMAGNAGALPCNKAKLQKIYALSKGVPGKAKQLFLDSLRGSKVLEKKTSSIGLSPFTVGLVVAFGILFCLLALLWPTAEDRVVEQRAELPDISLVKQVEVESESEAFDQLYDPQKSLEEDQLAKLEEKLLALQQELNAKVEAEPVVSVAAVQTEIVPQQKRIVDPSKHSDHEKAILSIKDSNYALQIVAASDEKKVKEFIKQHNLGSKARYYTSTRQGKPWYTVVYGNYPNKNAALADVANLPGSIKQFGPWARQYIHIQNTIKNQAHG